MSYSKTIMKNLQRAFSILVLEENLDLSSIYINHFQSAIQQPDQIVYKKWMSLPDQNFAYILSKTSQSNQKIVEDLISNSTWEVQKNSNLMWYEVMCEDQLMRLVMYDDQAKDQISILQSIDFKDLVIIHNVGTEQYQIQTQSLKRKEIEEEKSIKNTESDENSPIQKEVIQIGQEKDIQQVLNDMEQLQGKLNKKKEKNGRLKKKINDQTYQIDILLSSIERHIQETQNERVIHNNLKEEIEKLQTALITITQEKNNQIEQLKYQLLENEQQLLNKQCIIEDNSQKITQLEIRLLQETKQNEKISNEYLDESQLNNEQQIKLQQLQKQKDELLLKQGEIYLLQDQLIQQLNQQQNLNNFLQQELDCQIQKYQNEKNQNDILKQEMSQIMLNHTQECQKYVLQIEIQKKQFQEQTIKIHELNMINSELKKQINSSEKYQNQNIDYINNCNNQLVPQQKQQTDEQQQNLSTEDSIPEFDSNENNINHEDKNNIINKETNGEKNNSQSLNYFDYLQQTPQKQSLQNTSCFQPENNVSEFHINSLVDLNQTQNENKQHKNEENLKDLNSNNQINSTSQIQSSTQHLQFINEDESETYVPSNYIQQNELLQQTGQNNLSSESNTVSIDKQSTEIISESKLIIKSIHTEQKVIQKIISILPITSNDYHDNRSFHTNNFHSRQPSVCKKFIDRFNKIIMNKTREQINQMFCSSKKLKIDYLNYKKDKSFLLNKQLKKQPQIQNIIQERQEYEDIRSSKRDVFEQKSLNNLSIRCLIQINRNHLKKQISK